MRNASDIFCLNEDITDGNAMFSVNGSCPMRLRRRPIPQQNDCFEYGRSNIEKYDGGDAEVERHDLENLELSERSPPDQEIDKADTPRSVQYSTRAASECSVVTDNPETPKSVLLNNNAPSEFNVVTNRSERRSEDNRKIKNVQKVEDKHEPDNISISNMSRNPLTGAGMEITQHRKPKKGLGSKNDKWVW